MSEKSFNVARIFVKDVSTEMPQGSKIFSMAEAPALSLNLALEVGTLEENVYEVSLRGTLRAEIQGKAVYLVEVQQAGIFEASGYDAQELNVILSSSCPNILYPYLRSSIAQQLTLMSVPVYYLPELNIQYEAVAEQPKSAND